MSASASIEEERDGGPEQAERAEHCTTSFDLFRTKPIPLDCGAGTRVLDRPRTMKALEEAGIVQARTDGTRRMMSLRLDDMNKKFPGLLELVASQA